MQPAESVPPPKKSPETELEEDVRQRAPALSAEDVRRVARAVEISRGLGAHTTVTLTIGQFWGVIVAIVVALLGAKAYADATFASKEALTALAADVKNLPTKDRIDAIDKRLDGMDKRLETMDKRIEEMDKRLTGSIQQLDKTITSFIAVQQSRRTP